MSDFVYRDRTPGKRLNGSKLPASVQYRIDQPNPGYVAVRPQSQDGVFSFGILTFSLIAFLAFKVLMVVALKPTVYGLRVDLLAQGNAIEQFGARLLSLDPITQFFSQMILFFL